tara:strand:- start:9618 stop:11732 length:2115 start_codon:yes stop_codon:yes gene_type:complete
MPVYENDLLHSTLKKYFGFDSFRNQQEEIIRSVLDQKDCMVIMPTGGGKSICFQLPAVLLEGVTLVISPLIALMKDQVDGLRLNGIEAAYYNSSQEGPEQQQILEDVASSKLKLLYVAPESLKSLDPILRSRYISAIAIDEAHCISSWGHDFRPSYQQLSFLKASLPNTPIIALTATADKATRQDIMEQLGIPDAKQYLTSFDRKNIYLEVRPANDRVGQIMDFIAARPEQAGIIYCLSRKSTEQLQARLEQKGLKAHAYHAGLDFGERTQVQEDFIFDRVKVVCATVAFGMGIDKSNVRWVIHYNMPKNLEGYYQEIGRSGRDGSKARALLFHSYADVLQLRKFMVGAANEDLQMAKLDRMKQFSEASSCRRRILLSYFGELLETNCGNCDVCQNPPQFFDGTILAQKALSVMARLKEKEAMGTVIDVLRGSHNAHIMDKNYDSLPSYGIGKDVSWKDWQHYIIQLMDQGFCEIAFHEHNALRLTNFSKAVLFQGMKVQMSRPLLAKETPEARKETKSGPKKTGSLFERLRLLRLKLALEGNIPAYLIFSDATLKELEAERPLSENDFLSISGVGQRKMEVYGDAFISEIKAFMEEKDKGRKKSDTLMVTYGLYQDGLDVETIAQERNLKDTTIYSHLAQLYLQGKDVDLERFLAKGELEAIKKAHDVLEAPEGLKPYFEHLEEKIPYSSIRLALAIIEKEKQ